MDKIEEEHHNDSNVKFIKNEEDTGNEIVQQNLADLYSLSNPCNEDE